jgi:pimeloyl-ACP methyl ester carboxylesterase
VPLLAGQFRVTAYDLRGHGYSAMPPSRYTSADMALDLLALFDALSIARAHVVGHSFGGLVALHFAALYPQRVLSLTVGDSRVLALQPVQRLKDWVHWALWRRRLERLGVALDGDEPLDHELLLRLGERGGAAAGLVPFARPGGGPRGTRRWGQLLATTTARQDLKDPAGLTVEKIRGVRPPALAVYGEYSFFLPSCRGLRDNLPDCDVVLLRGVGHAFPLLRPLAFAASLKEFLTRRPAQRD